MLLNEFLKEHRKVEEQGSQIAQIKSTETEQRATITRLESLVTRQQRDFQAAIAGFSAKLEEQAAQLQKVSD